MQWQNWFRSANSDLNRASELLKSGEALNYAAEGIGSAVISGMTGWLLKHDLYKSGCIAQQVFGEKAPPELSQRGKFLLFRSQHLLSELLTDPDFDIRGKGWTLEKWKDSMHQEIENACAWIEDVEKNADEPL